MLPRDLKPEQFSAYPPEARKLASDYVGALRPLPLSFVSSLLREIIEYDFKFPQERRALERELGNLQSLSSAQIGDWFHEFNTIKLQGKLEQFDWVNQPAQFVEQLSAHLWSTHQLDAFRLAAMHYAERLATTVPAELPAAPRLGISIIGKGVDNYTEPLFRKLRPHGAYFSNVNPENGLKLLLEAVSARAQAYPGSYAHWYIDGGSEAEHGTGLTTVSYDGLAPTRTALLRKMQSEISRPGMGPENLRTIMAQMRPADVNLDSSDAVLSHFQLKLLTEGSGTQIYSTTFAQWAARETLRRAQPLTLLVRFAPRQRQRAMNELLSVHAANDSEPDVIGSLIDGDMGAYYNWINQQRLPGADKSSFMAWFEGQNRAVVIGPSVPRGTESTAPTDVKRLLSLIV
jgi:hypothetical protein